ncbi:hypothetical protein [Floccifex sp.]|uniref:hypothetical protein n=1 Tax=Floccifex sp. TaxID=2815810 RepID=UPI003F10C7FE
MKKEIVQNCKDCIVENRWVIYEDGFPFYQKEILALEEELYASLCMDPNCIENYQKIKDIPVSELNISQVYTYLTYIFKNEGFVIGFIDTYCKNGILYALLERV